MRGTQEIRVEHNVCISSKTSASSSISNLNGCSCWQQPFLYFSRTRTSAFDAALFFVQISHLRIFMKHALEKKGNQRIDMKLAKRKKFEHFHSIKTLRRIVFSWKFFLGFYFSQIFSDRFFINSVHFSFHCRQQADLDGVHQMMMSSVKSTKVYRTW